VIVDIQNREFCDVVCVVSERAHSLIQDIMCNYVLDCRVLSEFLCVADIG